MILVVFSRVWIRKRAWATEPAAVVQLPVFLRCLAGLLKPAGGAVPMEGSE